MRFIVFTTARHWDLNWPTRMQPISVFFIVKLEFFVSLLAYMWPRCSRIFLWNFLNTPSVRCVVKCKIPQFCFGQPWCREQSVPVRGTAMDGLPHARLCEWESLSCVAATREVGPAWIHKVRSSATEVFCFGVLIWWFVEPSFEHNEESEVVVC